MQRLFSPSIGERYGDLICVESRKNKGRSTEYLMKCSKCGRTKWMLASTIRRSSGVLHKACGKNCKQVDRTFYSRWQSMRTRTENPNYAHYKDYGGRGIHSEEFANFIDFYDAMYDSYKELADKIGSKNVSLERMDVNGDYTVGNCTWIDKHKQQCNCRRSIRFEVQFPDGHVEHHQNVRGFSSDHGLSASCVMDCLNGRLKSHRGYKFLRT